MATKELLVTATGRRKVSIARVRLKPGTGEFVVNDRTLDEYFGRETSKMILKQPLEVVEQLGKVDISINVCGGGLSGQAGAMAEQPADGDVPLTVGSELGPVVSDRGIEVQSALLRKHVGGDRDHSLGRGHDHLEGVAGVGIVRVGSGNAAPQVHDTAPM